MLLLIKRSGWIEVIAGCMFSGKSEELIRRIQRGRFTGQNIQVFKPAIDDRYHKSAIASHSGQREAATIVTRSEEVLALTAEDTMVVALDEVQFFDMGIVEVCERLANRGIRVIAAGLDQDFRGVPFGPTPKLLALAEYITKVSAVCVQCGDPATRTQRLINGVPAAYHDPIILVGATETYEARCRHCHDVPQKEGI